MLSTIYALMISTLAGMSTLLGSLVIFFKIDESNINKFVTLCLSFSIVIMIGISITDLIPPSFFHIISNYNLLIGILIFIILFIFGFLIVKVINYLMNDNYNSLYRLGVLSMIALILHNFPEGIATFMGSVKDVSLGLKLSLAIILHNIPEGIAIAVPIYYSTGSKVKAVYNTFISGIAEPVGAFVTYLILNRYVTDLMLSIVLIFVGGIMTILAIDEMFPKVILYKENKYIIIGFLLGIVILIISHFCL